MQVTITTGKDLCKQTKIQELWIITILHWFKGNIGEWECNCKTQNAGPSTEQMTCLFVYKLISKIKRRVYIKWQTKETK